MSGTVTLASATFVAKMIRRLPSRISSADRGRKTWDWTLAGRELYRGRHDATAPRRRRRRPPFLSPVDDVAAAAADDDIASSAIRTAASISSPVARKHRMSPPSPSPSQSPSSSIRSATSTADLT